MAPHSSTLAWKIPWTEEPGRLQEEREALEVVTSSLYMEFSRQENWSALPCPPPGDLPNPGIETTSPTLQADSLQLSHLESQWLDEKT